MPRPRAHTNANCSAKAMCFLLHGCTMHAPKKAPNERALAAVLTVIAAFLWSGGGVGVKVVATTPLSIAGYRALFALPVMVIALLVQAARAQVSPLFALRRPLAWGAAVAYATMVVSFVVAAKLTTAANAILIQYSGPIYVALLSWPLLRERMRKTDWLAIGGTVIGLCIFFSTEVSAQGQIGNLVAVVSSFGFGALPILLRLELRKLEQIGETRAAPMMPLAAMALGNLFAVFIGLHDMVSYPPQGASAWLAVALLGVFQIGVPYILYGIAVSRLRAVESSLLATVEPIMSPLWVYLATAEKPGPAAMIGGAIIVVSVLAPTVVAGRAQET